MSTATLDKPAEITQKKASKPKEKFPTYGPLRATVDKKPFAAALAAAKRCVAVRTSLPILTHVALIVRDGVLSVHSTDLELWMMSDVPLASLDGEGAATANAKQLLEYVNKLPDGPVSLSMVEDDTRLRVQSGKAKSDMVTLPTDEFPLFPDTNGELVTTLPASVIHRQINRVAAAISDDETRVILTSLCVEARENGLRFVATDTHRLMLSECAAEVGHQGVSLLPTAAVDAFTGAFPKGETDVTISINDNRLLFSCPGMSMATRLIDGQFPSYERVIPTLSNEVVTLPRQDLKAAVDRALLVASDNNNRLTFSLSGTDMKVSAKSPNRGTTEEYLSVQRGGNEELSLDFALNAKYLLETLGAIETDHVEISMAEALRPFVFHPTGDDHDTHTVVLMPMQVV